MKKIALIAYAVSNKYGSEYAVGWEFITNMAQTGKYKFVVYYGSCKGNSMGKVEQLPVLENVIWRCVELPNNLRNRFYWLIRRKVYYVFGFYFQFREWHKIVAEEICRDNAKEEFDVIHYLNPIGIKEPGESWKLDVPYVWGPMQGVENWPKCLYGILDLKGKVEAYLRRFIQNFSLNHSSRLKRAITKADVVVGATPNTCKQLSILFHKHSFYLPENGLKEVNKGIVKQYTKDSLLKIIWVGELSSRKGLIILLMAMKELGKLKNKVHLSVYGDGKQRASLQSYIERNDLSSCVSLYGKVSRTEVQKSFMKSHLHVITSLSEATTTVIWEAKACGVPTMTLDHCGMSGVVNDENGIKIPIVSLSQILNDMVLNIIKIIENPLVIESLSKGVINTNSLYSWNERCKAFDYIYWEAMKNHTTLARQ